MPVHQLTQFKLVNAYLVEEEDGLTLIDTHTMGGAKGILAAAERLGRPIRRIVLTHNHADHIGSLDKLHAALPDAEVIFGRREAKLTAQDFTPEPGEPKKAKSMNFPKVRTHPSRTIDPGDQVGSLEVHAAPGHTPGQLAFLDTRDRTLYCGDAYYTIGGLHVVSESTLKFPFPAIATTDKDAARRTGRALAALSPARIAPGHGAVLENPAAALEQANASA